MKGLRKTAVIAAAVLITVLLSDSEVYRAVAVTTTQQQLEQTQNEKNELENELENTNQDIEGLKETHSSLKDELDSLNGDLTDVSGTLEKIEQEMQVKEKDIEDTKAALDEAKATEEWQYECMVRRIRLMYERGDISYIDTLLGVSSVSDMVSVADCFEMIEAYDRKMLESYKETKSLIEEQESILESEYDELENLRIAAEAEKSKVSGLISRTANSIAEYAGQIDDAEKEALALEEEIRKKDEDIEYLQQKIAEEQAMSQQAANSTWRDISEVEFADGDRYLLANLIYCEAGGEPDAGKLAVGSVVINRVLSSVYPDTVVGVIYQDRQFSPVASGRLALALAENRATQSCYDAADQAMSGVTNVGSCVYFRTPVEGLTGIQIGGHIFY
ncbi:MAG: cell wall hydrolase [Lachnospiraceae bacterium]|nr:cell wall hydrolase [Lachnospiraceae bacterium]